jgi:putative transcriptional regulator
MKSKKDQKNKFFEGLKVGLQDIIDYQKGKPMKLRSELIDIPEPMVYKSKDIKKIRESGHYSQSIFAKVLNVSIKTVQSWESGDREPSTLPYVF